MKARLFLVFVFVVSQAFLTGGVTAQGDAPPAAPQSGGPPLPTGVGSQDVNAAVALGQPGLSFRYVQTFGVTETAYFSDTTHINFPYGLGVDGTNVWIADSSDNRALKFTNSGSFVTQIGRPGFRYGADGTDLEWIADVAVDGSGNIWIVDGFANHIAKFNSSGNFVSDLGVLWEWGSDNAHFGGPCSIAFDSAGNIYVSDAGNHRIQVFDSSGTYSTTIGVTATSGADNAHFDTPRHIAIDSSDNLYVADAANHRVQIFNSSHIYSATIGVSGVSGTDNSHFDWPMGVHVDASKIYVADGDNHRIQIFDRTTRAYQSTIGTGASGSGNNQFNFPSDVAVDSAGNIFVADQINTRVQQFNSSQVYVRTYGTAGVPYVTDGYHYNRPSGVAVAPDGSLYLTEEWGHRLLKLNAAGVPQWTVGEAGVSSSDNSHLNGPNDVDLDAAGRVYVADAWDNRVQIFNGNGTYSTTLGTGGGSGDYQFQEPRGLAVDSAGNIYVADRFNHRVQIYNSSLTRIATLGVTSVMSTTNGYFNEPYDVAVDSGGNIYVVENANHRVQVFNSSRAYVRTIGESGVAGNDFGHFSNPTAIAVDAAGRIYVADQWGGRVQVFDNNGAYQTTVGGSWGNGPGSLRQAEGLAFDQAGNLYVAEFLNHRIQKFSPGVPGWRQSNINGFGDQQNSMLSLASFDGQLYAGTYNPGSGNGSQLWRTSDGIAWTSVMTNGFGNAANVGIDHLMEFNGNFYAGTWANEVNGGEVWRSGNGLNWTRVISQGFGDPTNGEIYRFAVFNNQIYATTWSYTTTHGVEIWRSSTGNSGDWTQVVSNGLDGDTNNVGVPGFEEFNGYLYAGTYNNTTGGEVWRSSTGNAGDWTRVNTDGFGTANNRGISALAAFKGYLYAGTRGVDNIAGTQVWRCQICDGTDWTKVVDNGFGNVNTYRNSALEVFDGRLYLVVGNLTTGMEVWRTTDGANWEQVGFAGFGDSNNSMPYWDNSVVVFNNSLYIGTINFANGGEIWQYVGYPVYLPLIRK